MKYKGTCHKFWDNINTDEIIPARYLNTSEPKELAMHCMEDADADFMKKIKPGDIIVAGDNFGCGSSREHAPIAIKAADLSCVIAKSFARIFYRNCINIALPILECPEAVDGIESGNQVEVDFTTGLIKNLTTGKEFTAKPFPPFMQELMEKGGLMEMVKTKIS